MRLTFLQEWCKVTQIFYRVTGKITKSIFWKSEKGRFMKQPYYSICLLVSSADYLCKQFRSLNMGQQRVKQNTVISVLSGHSKRTPKLVLNTDYRLIQVKGIAECPMGSILQYFQPSLSYHFSLRPLFCLF